jgi:hypothetical protein
VAPELQDPDTLDGWFVPRLRDEVAFVRVENEGLLYVEESGLLHRLDRIGTIVCERFDGRASIAAVAEELAEAFRDDRGVVETHVVTFVRQLGRLGLLDGVAEHASTEAREDAR